MYFHHEILWTLTIRQKCWKSVSRSHIAWLLFVSRTSLVVYEISCDVNGTIRKSYLFSLGCVIAGYKDLNGFHKIFTGIIRRSWVCIFTAKMWCFVRFGTICTILKAWKKDGGVLLLVKIHGCFPGFLICTNGTKSRKTSQILRLLMAVGHVTLTNCW